MDYTAYSGHHLSMPSFPPHENRGHLASGVALPHNLKHQLYKIRFFKLRFFLVASFRKISYTKKTGRARVTSTDGP